MYKVDMYVRVRRACMVEGMSIREADRVFGLHRDTVRKMLMYSVPPGYRRERPPRRPKLEPYTGVIDRILDEELGLPKKQRHTAKRVRFSMASSSGSTTSFWTVPHSDGCFVKAYPAKTTEAFCDGHMSGDR